MRRVGIDDDVVGDFQLLRESLHAFGRYAVVVGAVVAFDWNVDRRRIDVGYVAVESGIGGKKIRVVDGLPQCNRAAHAKTRYAEFRAAMASMDPLRRRPDVGCNLRPLQFLGERHEYGIVRRVVTGWGAETPVQIGRNR